MAFKWNPKSFVGSFTGTIGGRQFAVQFGTGYMDGTFIDSSYAEDQVTTHNGADGITTFVLNANAQATCVITLAQGADQNKQLSQLVPIAKRDYMPFGVFSMKDLNSETYVKSPVAVIGKMAPLQRGKDVQGSAWSFILSDAEFQIGSGLIG